jgi:hypothetical protein
MDKFGNIVISKELFSARYDTRLNLGGHAADRKGAGANALCAPTFFFSLMITHDVGPYFACPVSKKLSYASLQSEKET